MALGEHESAAGAPAVRDQIDGVDVELVEQLFDEVRVGVRRVDELPGLGRAAEAGQVGRDAASAFEERDHVVGACRQPVQEQPLGTHCGGTAEEHGHLVELDRVLVGGHEAARITWYPMAAILCLGETLVDFICERPVAEVAEADVFVPHFGGAAANVAVLTARAGVSVALASTVGDDAWGRWLRERLVAEGVDVEHRQRAPARRRRRSSRSTTTGEASFQIYGESTVRTGAGRSRAHGRAVLQLQHARRGR